MLRDLNRGKNELHNRICICAQPTKHCPRGCISGLDEARTFFFIPSFIIALLFLWPNYLAGGLQRGPCATSGCKHRGMCLNGLIKVHHIARLLPSCCSLPGVVWFQMKVGLMKPWRHSQGFHTEHCKAWILCVSVPKILQLWWMLLKSRWAVEEKKTFLD